MTLEKAIELIRLEYANALKLKHIKKPWLMHFTKCGRLPIEVRSKK